jgi:hypothetical protein
MSSAPTGSSLPKPHETSLVAALLSYLIPGLGQIYQGRFGKGFLFMVSLLGMFFLGQYMGNWQNVYMPHGDQGANRSTVMLFGISVIYFHLPLMLVIISLVYSATRHEDWDEILGEAWRWGIRMFGFILCVAVVLFAASFVI